MNKILKIQLITTLPYRTIKTKSLKFRWTLKKIPKTLPYKTHFLKLKLINNNKIVFNKAIALKFKIKN